NIDAIPRVGGDQPDFFADATLGQDDDNPIVAHASLLGYPRFVRIFTHEGIDQTLDKAEFHACDWDFDADPPACKAGADGQVGLIAFTVRNWLTRPANLPVAAPLTPNFA